MITATGIRKCCCPRALNISGNLLGFEKKLIQDALRRVLESLLGFHMREEGLELVPDAEGVAILRTAVRPICGGVGMDLLGLRWSTLLLTGRGRTLRQKSPVRLAFPLTVVYYRSDYYYIDKGTSEKNK